MVESARRRLAGAPLVLVLAFLAATSSFQALAIKLQPEGRDKFYWSGEQFVITCQNNNNIKNVKIRWIGPNGADITEDRSQRVHAESTGPHGHRLVVMNATAPDDDGQYKCTLGSTDDRNPREHIEFNLKLYKTTSFKDTARHLVLAAGHTGTLTCAVEFDPNVSSASVSWVRDQKPIEMFNDSSYTVLDYDNSRQLSQLVVSPLTKQHGGIYTCRAVAVTAQLSKISDHDIQLETNYAPAFDKDSHTVWVERAHGKHQHHQQHQQHQTTVYGSATGAPHSPGRPSGHQHQRNRFTKPHYAGWRPLDSESDANANNTGASPAGLASASGGNSSAAQVVRVELRCSVQANPPASILWTSTQNSNFVLAKGAPAHVLEDPQTEVEGQNATSVLVIGYSLDPDWPYRRDSYQCSASNKLGKATKTFNVEQGDPPPAFNVGPHKHYNPQTSLFIFTLLGPNYDPEAASGLAAASARHEIVPPVDSFRIRAENPLSVSEPKTNYWPNSRRHNEHSTVQWSLNGQQQAHNDQTVSANHQQHALVEQTLPTLQLGAPHNFTVSLGKLPSGNQKLFLEAHNAVGWSPNATYLGDYYIVSGTVSLMARGGSSLMLIIHSLGYLLISSIVMRPLAAPA